MHWPLAWCIFFAFAAACPQTIFVRFDTLYISALNAIFLPTFAAFPGDIGRKKWPLLRLYLTALQRARKNLSVVLVDDWRLVFLWHFELIDIFERRRRSKRLNGKMLISDHKIGNLIRPWEGIIRGVFLYDLQQLGIDRPLACLLIKIYFFFEVSDILKI